MSFPDPGTPDLNSTEGSSWPTYSPAGLSNMSVHSEVRLSHNGLWKAIAEETAPEGALLAALPASRDPANAKATETPMATSADRFNRLSFRPSAGPGVAREPAWVGHVDRGGRRPAPSE